MSIWWLSLALLLFCEGAVIAIAPKQWQNAMRQLTALPPQILRRMGIALVSGAFMIVGLMLYFG
ncbi:DUF2065 domain-containing protein [Dichelobacter nodosus]|uniref:DUF2065 domain-containing protein n=1 Tax=Dichelobacter nodosus TaxID=870 RepID=UPI0002FF1E50|nr:DUF2065 family protein [Dichelobacter nodosus]AXM45470.1 DUF2065 domain-containing protein [Dichelobacter nodosus]KNZ39839.1 hypothetical protein AKG33_01460 [Dichelobacter nodosus]TGA66664.1 DUF2065 domain-containing protein [Dichelobacter nodosus]